MIEEFKQSLQDNRFLVREVTLSDTLARALRTVSPSWKGGYDADIVLIRKALKLHDEMREK